MQGKHTQSQCCYFDRRKKRFGAVLVTATVTAMLCAAAMIVILWAAWHGMSRELCARDLSPHEYKEMKLDCREYGFDRQ